MGGQLVKTKEVKRDIAVVKKEIANLTHKDDPTQILKEAEKKLMTLDYDSYTLTDDDPIAKAMTLREFDNGTLLSMATPESYKTFGIDLMRKIQIEYGCVSASEKATAELAASNYVRTLVIQRHITNYLSLGTISEIGVKFLAVLGKELDRANRHYLTTIQTLRMLKQPPIQVNIKTNTAVVGQNQIVQTNSNNELK